MYCRRGDSSCSYVPLGCDGLEIGYFSLLEDELDLLELEPELG